MCLFFFCFNVWCLLSTKKCGSLFSPGQATIWNGTWIGHFKLLIQHNVRWLSQMHCDIYIYIYIKICIYTLKLKNLQKRGI